MNHFDPRNPISNATDPINPAADDMPAVESQTIAALREEGDNLLPELIELFLNSAPAAIMEMEKALRGNDLKAVAFQAHRLKGNAGSFGAHRMSELCHALELASNDGKCPAAEDLLRRLTLQCERVCRALEAER